MGPFEVLAIQKVLLALALYAGTIKLASTLYLLRHAAPARELLTTPLGKSIFYASKLSTLVFVLALLLRAYLSSDSQSTILNGFLFIGALLLTLLVVHLRRTRQWFGVAHSIYRARRKYRS